MDAGPDATWKVTGSPLLAVGALLFGGVVNAVHIPLEEARLARRFGGWYRDYTGATRRWL